MTGVCFLILFGLNCLLPSCSKGAITSPPPDGTQYVFLPGKTAKIKWEFDDPISSLQFRSWYFTSSDGSLIEGLATISGNKSTNIRTRLFEVDIERPGTLVLKNVNQSYTGMYKFTLVTIHQAFTSSVTVSITIGPKDTSIELNPNPATLNQSFTITCSSRGFPEPSYKISHNGTHLIDDKTYTINNVGWSHAGVYECNAENGFGPTDKVSKFLKVTGRGPIIQKPSIPNTSEKSSGTVVVWHIVVTLLAGIIIGILFSYIVSCSRRRCLGNRKSGRNSEPLADGVDTTYQELDLTKMSTEDNYQSLRGNAAVRASNDAADDDEESIPISSIFL